MSSLSLACSAPYPLRGPSLSFHSCRLCVPCVSSGELVSSSIQNVRKSLVRHWKPVCSLVGDAVSGAKFAPFTSPLPPASSRGWADPQPASSSLELLSPFVLRTGQQCIRLALARFSPVNFLSLLLSHSLSCYLTLAPSDCPQDIQARSLP